MANRQKQDSRKRQTPPRRQPQPRVSQRRRTNKTSQKPPRPPSKGPFSAKIVVAIFFAFVFIYIGHSIWVFMTPGVNTMIVRMETIDSPRSIPGVIIRDEQVHFANSAGYVQFRVQDNERVGVNAPIVSIVQDPASAQAAMGYLSGIESVALNTQDRRPATYTVDAGVSRINHDLTNIVNGRIHSFNLLNLSEIYALRDDVNRRINTRNQISAGSAIAARESLARDYQHHMAVLGASTRNMYAAASGIMSRLIDGHESDFTRAMIGSLTRDDIRALADQDTLTPVTEVQEGDPVFKIVGNVWHIATYMPNDMVAAFVEGATRTIYLHNANTGNYEPHSLRVERIEYGVRYSLVVFRNTRYVTDFMSQRNISIRTTTGIQRGLKIPYTAIVTQRHYRIPFDSIHGETDYYVVITTETGRTRVPVTFDGYTDYHAYIPVGYGLAIGDTLVPRDPDAGSHVIISDAHLRILHGVYAVEFGTTVFRTVNLGGSNIEAGYILLDPSLNQGIREFNKIVTNASTVVEGQIIR